jgi:hypothetical protein
MGLFYANLTVYLPPRAALLAELRRLQREAFLSPTLGGHTAVFDKGTDEQRPQAIERLGHALTKALSCSALASALHDDDVLYLWLFRNGRCLDRYDSSPSYFDPSAEHRPPAGGDSRLLCEAFGRPERRDQVERLLRANLLERDLPAVRDEQGRHAALAAELGLPPFVAGVCYSSIAGGYVPEDFIPPEHRGITFEPVGRD